MTKPVVIVTGGASGMGRATCRRLQAEGFPLAVFDIPGPGAKEVAGDDGLGLEVDVADAASVEEACAAVVARFGRIDVLVNNAGIGRPAATVCHETPLEDWDRILAVNVRGPFLCSRAVLPTMVGQGSGQIITVASIVAFVAMPGRCAYTASKGAVLMLTKSIAVDYARFGIRANAICPGVVQTPLVQSRLDDPAQRDEWLQQVPLRRVAQPEEIAEAIYLLASGRLSYMNGSAWVIDGGWTA